MSRPLQSWRRLAAVTASMALLSGALSLALAQESAEKPPKKESTRESFTAFAVNMGTAGTPRGKRSGTVSIIVERWSTDEERRAMVQAFMEKGQDGLLTQLRKTPRLGTIRTPNTLGWELHYAVQVPTEDGGRRILLGTDREMGYWEASNQPRTTDYPFTLVEMRLDKEGKGEGKLSLATQISVSKDGRQVELENYSSEPVRLQKVVQNKR